MGGLPLGTATMLPIMLSEGVNKGRVSLEKLVEVCCSNNAKVYGMYPKKGIINIGSDADLVIVDLKKEVTISPDLFQTAADYTPYDGWKLRQS
ncbi:amidohydrolase family protein [Chloroflexota bacterium]